MRIYETACKITPNIKTPEEIIIKRFLENLTLAIPITKDPITQPINNIMTTMLSVIEDTDVDVLQKSVVFSFL